MIRIIMNHQVKHSIVPKTRKYTVHTFSVKGMHAQTGSIALYLVMTISLLLMTTTVLGARLSISETQQGSDVDQSNAAYYAAEAGVEEASRRLDANENKRLALKEIFPEQWNSEAGGQSGDRAVLIDNDGNSTFPNVNINNDPRDEHGQIVGRLAWRQRRVYEEPRAPKGTLVKDETVELDASELRRECASGEYAGEDEDNDGTYEDCDGGDIFARFQGVELCWTSRPVRADMEFTVLSYPENSPENINTDKLISSGGGGAQNGNHVRLENTSGSAGHDNCAELQGINSDRRYIFRVRPLFPQEGAQDQEDAGLYRVEYRTELLDQNSPNGNPLFIPDDTVLIDVTGQSGDVRRRIIARKQRQGRILGIFDYVLYSGSESLPLCKVGVQQRDEPNIPGVRYDLGDPQCRPSSANNNPSSSDSSSGSGSDSGSGSGSDDSDATTATIAMPRDGMDTFVTSEGGYQSTNFHDHAELHVNTSTNGSRDRTRYSYLQFPSGEIPENATITNATLKLVQTDHPESQTSTVRIRVRRMDVDWNHEAIDWDSREWGSGTPEPGYTNVSYNPGSATEWDVTEIVQSWNQDTFENYGFVLAVQGTNGDDDGRYFHSSNNSENRPKLEITYE